MNNIGNRTKPSLGSRPGGLEICLLSIALLLGFFQVWLNRYRVGVDIITYMDMGDAYFRGDWPMAVSNLWPPLYAWLLGFAHLVLAPSPFWEYPVVQLVNYLVFVSALFAFRYFLKEFRLYYADKIAVSAGSSPSLSNDLHLVVIGYALFIWSSVSVIKVSQANPDMLMSVFVYAIDGLLLKAARTGLSIYQAILLGVAMGFGYLDKPIMLPLSIITLALFFLMVRKSTPSRAALAFLALGAVAGPFICILSVKERKFTYNDQGLYNYVWHVSGGPHETLHWTVEGPTLDKAEHPARKLWDHPEVFEYATPIKGTYPIWYDPGYWWAGTKFHFDLKGQLKALYHNSVQIGAVILLGLDGAIGIALFLSFGMSLRASSVARDLLKYWFLLIPAVAAIAMYWLIAIEPRYLGVFATIILLVLIAGSPHYSKPLSNGIAAFMIIMCLIVTYKESSKAVVTTLTGKWHQTNFPSAVADALQKLGLEKGDRIASVNLPIADISRCARLAKVQIIAEAPYLHGDSNGFWGATPQVRAHILDLFAQAGAVMVVSNERPRGPDANAWKNLGVADDTADYGTEYDYYAYLLPKLVQRNQDKRPFTVAQIKCSN